MKMRTWTLCATTWAFNTTMPNSVACFAWQTTTQLPTTITTEIPHGGQQCTTMKNSWRRCAPRNILWWPRTCSLDTPTGWIAFMCLTTTELLAWWWATYLLCTCQQSMMSFLVQIKRTGWTFSMMISKASIQPTASRTACHC